MRPAVASSLHIDDLTQARASRRPALRLQPAGLPATALRCPGDHLLCTPEGVSMHPRQPDPAPPELAALIGRAAHVLNTHASHDGLCAICGCAWPCERAALAEHNLAAL
ncbi:MAG: hypothetical protein ACREP9_05960 [Candidatus Dormibacteraceae bacterium]